MPAGRSTRSAAARRVRACRRPSRPSVAHGTRLSGPPLTVGPVHRAASSDSITGTSRRRTRLDLADRPAVHGGGGRAEQAPGRRRARPASTAAGRRAAPTRAAGRPGWPARARRTPSPARPPTTPAATASERELDAGSSGSSAASCGIAGGPASVEQVGDARGRPGPPPGGSRSVRAPRAGRPGPARRPGWPAAASPPTPVTTKRQPDLAEQPAGHRLARPRRHAALHRQSERDGREVGEQRERALPGRCRRRPVRPAPLGDAPAACPASRPSAGSAARSTGR